MENGKTETRGRKPKNGKAMSNSERQLAWRNRQRIQKDKAEQNVRVGLIKDWDENTCLMILSMAKYQASSDEENPVIDLPQEAWRRLGQLRGYTLED